MKVLFLDDDKERIKKARPLFIGHNLTVVENEKDAVAELDKITFELVSLDHDMAGCQMVPSGPGTGFEVAEFIASLDRAKQPKYIILHSFNEDGCKNMYKVLESANSKLNIKILAFGSENYIKYIERFSK
jgi:CheY-like chemotaxis protein